MSFPSSMQNFQKRKSHCQLTENSLQNIIMFKGKKNPNKTKHKQPLTPLHLLCSSQKICSILHVFLRGI